MKENKTANLSSKCESAMDQEYSKLLPSLKKMKINHATPTEMTDVSWRLVTIRRWRRGNSKRTSYKPHPHFINYKH